MARRKVDKLILHCSDTPDSMDIGFKEINQWHKEKGWLDKKSDISCGYHYIIRKNGKIEAGRPETSTGAHCYGQNRSSIGICWVGRNDLNKKQRKALKSLCLKLLDERNLKPFDVYGHSEFDEKKTCPNLNMHSFRIDILFPSIKD